MSELNAILHTLGATALWTASVRARESTREDRLFYDPWAEVLAGDGGAAWLAQRSEESIIPIVLRTRYFDDFLQRITAQHRIRQIVLVAAGLDTRAFRLSWPQGARVFELDQPGVLNYKEGILHSLGARATCERQIIAKDLLEPWQEALLASSFNAQEPSGWLLEGLLFYLPGETIIRLIDQVIGLASPESWLGFDIINSVTLTSPFTKSWIDMQAQSGAAWIGFMDVPEGFLTSRGWEAALTPAGQPDANYGRWVLPVIPTRMPNMPHNWFVTTTRPALPVSAGE